MSDEPAGNGEAAGAAKPSDDGAGRDKKDFSETPAFSPGPAFFSSPAGSMLVATETASAGEAPVTAVTAVETEAPAPAAAAHGPVPALATEAAADEWDDRQLCIDGGCVGVLDETGACRVCGKVDPDFKAPASRPAEGPRSSAALHDGEEGGGAEGSGTASSGGDEWEDRKLCEDGACIGVVLDGRCNTCGRAG